MCGGTLHERSPTEAASTIDYSCVTLTQQLSKGVAPTVVESRKHFGKASKVVARNLFKRMFP